MAEKKYQKYVFSDCLEKPNLPDYTNAKTGFSFRGARQIPGAGSNFGWSLISKPMLLEKNLIPMMLMNILFFWVAIPRTGRVVLMRKLISIWERRKNITLSINQPWSLSPKV